MKKPEPEKVFDFFKCQEYAVAVGGFTDKDCSDLWDFICGYDGVNNDSVIWMPTQEDNSSMPDIMPDNAAKLSNWLVKEFGTSRFWARW